MKSFPLIFIRVLPEILPSYSKSPKQLIQTLLKHYRFFCCGTLKTNKRSLPNLKIKQKNPICNSNNLLTLKSRIRISTNKNETPQKITPKTSPLKQPQTRLPQKKKTNIKQIYHLHVDIVIKFLSLTTPITYFPLNKNTKKLQYNPKNITAILYTPPNNSSTQI